MPSYTHYLTQVLLGGLACPFLVLGLVNTIQFRDWLDLNLICIGLVLALAARFLPKF